ncbi:MAG: hypothetical protein IT355_07760 [Gemmatimonadaceae bacterium]|nr:hypothetical protein [Gemmatimonadaceae bacterium]
MWRSFLLAVVLAPVAACTTLSNTARSYLTAPNGMQVDDNRVRTMLHRGMADSALRAVGNRRSPLSPDDRLLRLLYQGTAARYAGHSREAATLFDQAFAVSEDRFTKSVSRIATSMVTNDYALPYTAGRNERLLLHYNALLAWNAAGDPDGAAVEARRLVTLLATFGRPDRDERPLRAMLHALAAATFEASGDWSDAVVARRNAIALGAPLDSTLTPPADSLGDVVVVVERGDVAHKVAVGLTVPIYTGDNAGTGGAGFAAERLLGDFAALRNGGVWYDDTPSWRFTETRYAPWREARVSYLLDLSWPVLHRAPFAGGGTVAVVAGGASASADVTASISDAIAADYRRDRGALMSRTLSRAVTKYLAARAVEAAAEAAAKNDSDDGKKKKKRGDGDAARAAGSLARMFANVAGTALERADTRAWTLLPGDVALVRMRIPAGTHELLVDAAGMRVLSLPGVVVRAGRTTIVSGRLWTEHGEGVRAVFERTATHQPAPQR